MTSNFFPIARSVLSNDALRKHLLEHYDLPSSITCRLYSRYATDIYRVEAGDKRFWLRVYHHDEFTQAAIEAEVTILNELAQQNLPVVRLVHDHKGNYFHRLAAPEGKRYSVLTIHAPGSAPGREINVAQAAQYGEAVAQLHLTLDTFPQRYERPQIGLTELLDEPLAYLEPMLPRATSRLALLLRTCRTIEASPCSTTNPYTGLWTLSRRISIRAISLRMSRGSLP